MATSRVSSELMDRIQMGFILGTRVILMPEEAKTLFVELMTFRLEQRAEKRPSCGCINEEAHKSNPGCKQEDLTARGNLGEANVEGK